MKTKLTLFISESVVSAAKVYARDQRSSLSNIVEEYLKSLTANMENEMLLEIVRELKGSVKTPKKFKSYKNTLEKITMAKYK